MKRFSLIAVAISAAFLMSPAFGLADCGSCGAEREACHADQAANCCGTCDLDKAHEAAHAAEARHAHEAEECCGSCDRAKPRDIVDTAVAAGDFGTLAAALKAAGLVETLKGEGPFTVFAPTDKAFAKLPKGTIEDLLKPENRGQLTAILTYHVVPGKVLAEDVVKLSKAKTVQGSEVKIRVKKDKVRVDNALVTATDIACTNGVIHVIDSVILPN
jgi:uncharacterized surface protein with fasciclin (FAS1) repeats